MTDCSACKQARLRLVFAFYYKIFTVQARRFKCLFECSTDAFCRQLNTKSHHIKLDC